MNVRGPTFFFFSCVSSSAGTVFLNDFFPVLPLGFAIAGGAPAASSADFFPAPQGFDNGGGAADAQGMGAAAPAAASATTVGAVAQVTTALTERLEGRLSPVASVAFDGDFFITMADV